MREANVAQVGDATPRGNPGHRKASSVRAPETSQDLPRGGKFDAAFPILLIGILSIVFIWSYFDGLGQLVRAWERQPDYSHGYLVAPIALLFLWVRRANFPRERHAPDWLGYVLLGLSVALLHAGHRYFLIPMIHWSLVVWIAAACCLLCGRRVLVWAMPSILFLLFMIPLPYRMESLLSAPLQRVATLISTWSLQLLGQQAVAEGNIIFLGAKQIEIAHACSGLRMLVMVAALAFAFGVLVSRNWYERIFLALCILPVAVTANCLRIVATGLAYQMLDDTSSQSASHDIAGWTVIPAAAVLMGIAVVYARHLFVEYERAPLTPVAPPQPG